MGDAQCPRCLEFEEEVRELHQRLAAVGQYVTYSPGPNTNPNVEHELQRWLAVNSRADAAAGFRAGWARLARFVSPKLREWEARWWRAVRENDQLKARVGSLLRDLSRLSEREGNGHNSICARWVRERSVSTECRRNSATVTGAQ